MTRAERQHDSGRRATIINRRSGARLRNETTRDDHAELWNGRTDGHAALTAAGRRLQTSNNLGAAAVQRRHDRGPWSVVYTG